MIKKWTVEESNLLKENVDKCLSQLKLLLPEKSEDALKEIKLLRKELSKYSGANK